MRLSKHANSARLLTARAILATATVVLLASANASNASETVVELGWTVLPSSPTNLVCSSQTLTTTTDAIVKELVRSGGLPGLTVRCRMTFTPRETPQEIIDECWEAAYGEPYDPDADRNCGEMPLAYRQEVPFKHELMVLSADPRLPPNAYDGNVSDEPDGVPSVAYRVGPDGGALPRPPRVAANREQYTTIDFYRDRYVYDYSVYVKPSYLGVDLDEDDARLVAGSLLKHPLKLAVRTTYTAP